MTIKEYTDANAAYRRRMNRFFAVSFVFGIAHLVVMSRYMDSLRAYFARDFGEQAAGLMLLASLILPFVVVLFGGLLIMDRRNRRDPRLRCPHCEKSIEMCQALVVTTRNCPSCGKRVVDEPV